MRSAQPPPSGTRSWSLKKVLVWTAIGMAGLLILSAIFGGEDSGSPTGDANTREAPVRSTAQPVRAAPPWSGASVSGTGQSVKEIPLVEGQLVCEATVSGNTIPHSTGPIDSHFSVWIKGESGSNLLVNDSGDGTWQGVVRVRDPGGYLVEVDAEQRASWKVSCRQPR